MLKVRIIGVFFICCYGSLFAQDTSPQQEYLSQPIEERSFDEDKWEELTKDLNYERGGRKQRERKERSSNRHSLWTSLGQVVLIALLIGGLAFLILQLMGKNYLPFLRNKKIRQKEKMDVAIENVEESLEASDLDPMIRKAEKELDFAGAVRLYYMKVLKELNRKNLIRWEKDKTNGDYLKELKTSPVFASFHELTGIFENIWYGGVEVAQSGYKEVVPKFGEVLERLK